MIREHRKITNYEYRAAECDALAEFSTDLSERALYLRIAAHFREFADNLRREVLRGCAANSDFEPRIFRSRGYEDVKAISLRDKSTRHSGRSAVIIDGGIRSRS